MNDLIQIRKLIKECQDTLNPHLDLGNCGITDLEEFPELLECKHLKTLILNENQITDIIFLENLTGLQELDLRNNQIRKIPISIFQLNMKINMNSNGGKGFCLYGNPIELPPLEIIKQGKQSVLDWLEATSEKLNEIKIILIGEPKAGKTSLLKRLKDNSFNENEVQTDGINIEEIAFGQFVTFKQQKSLHKITGHFWDFGGQEIMNAIHQFFLTKRSIYVLVLDARKDFDNTTQIRHWTKRVRATGGDSPIIVLANQIDVNPSFGFENERELREEFPQIKCFIKVSCKTNENIELFKDKLAELIPTAELFKTEIDGRWITIKNKLQKETKQKYYLNESRFLKICNEVRLTEKQEQKNVINFLHDLGLVLHFDDLNLSEYYILNPYWITYGAYQILTSKYAGYEKGIVSMDKLEYIVNEEEDKKESYQPANYKKISYSTNERRFLIDILHQFKLCFFVPNGSQFIIPDLLDTAEPLNITNPIRQSEKSIQFVYKYDYLPKSVMPNIMIETHQMIEHMWRTGCVLSNTECKALITNYQNRISITVIGEYKKKREFMSIIRFTIDTINQKLSNRPIRLIPLPGIKDGFVDYERLLTREKKGKTEYIHDEDKPAEKRFLISELLEGFPSEEEVKEVKNFAYKTISIFLASSEELKEDRKEFEVFINRENKELIEKGIFLELVIWEDFVDVISQNRLQDEYNNTVISSDIFVSLFWKKAGKYTKEEFRKVFGHFKEKKKPVIFTYFKNTPVNIEDIRYGGMNNLFDFKQELENLGHFYTNYENINDLKFQFKMQLSKLLPEQLPALHIQQRKQLPKLTEKWIKHISGRIPYTNKTVDIELNGNNLIVTGGNGSGKTLFVKTLYEIILGNNTPSLDNSDEDIISPEIPMYFTLRNLLLKNKAIVKFYEEKRLSEIKQPKVGQQIDIKEKLGSQLEQYLLNLDYLQSKEKNKKLAKDIQNWFEDFQNNLKFLFEDENLILKLNLETDTPHFQIIQKDKPPFTFQTLSAGYRAIFDIYADLLVHTGHFKIMPNELTGIVFIDEIDSHLHVSLQRLILPFFTQSFPKIQFVITTHSPFIVSSVNNTKIYVCQSQTDYPIVTEKTDLYSNKPVEEILMSPLFNTSNFNNEISNLLKVRKEALKDNNEEKIIEIENILLDKNPEFFNYLNIEKLIKNIGK